MKSPSSNGIRYRRTNSSVWSFQNAEINYFTRL
jgi:hypothetical protein